MSAHSVEVTFSGAVFEIHLLLERQPFNLKRDPATGQFVGRNESFEISGDLEIELNGKAMNGTAWNLSVKVDSHGPFERKGTAQGGAFGFDEVSVPLPLKDKEKGS